jgi:hypothetical protein
MDPVSIITMAIAVIELYNKIFPDHPFSVSSWFRSVAHNTAVGGDPESRHLEGGAVDLVPDNPEHGLIIEAKAQELGFHAVWEKGHVHIQIKPPRAASA